jgi:hypothetical protein
LLKAYCKAYPLSALRDFPSWATEALPAEQALADEDFIYVCDDFSVVADPIDDNSVIFPGTSAGWHDYCRNVLKYAVPDDLVAYS